MVLPVECLVKKANQVRIPGPVSCRCPSGLLETQYIVSNWAIQDSIRPKMDPKLTKLVSNRTFIRPEKAEIHLYSN